MASLKERIEKAKEHPLTKVHPNIRSMVFMAEKLMATIEPAAENLMKVVDAFLKHAEEKSWKR